MKRLLALLFLLPLIAFGEGSETLKVGTQTHNVLSPLTINWIGTTLDFTGATVTGLGGGLTLQTNGTPNGSQTLLNLAAGSNVTLTDNGSGQVTIASAAGGSGTVTSVAVSGANGIGVSGSPITTSGTISLSLPITIAGTSGKTLTVSNSLTLAGTDGSTLNVGGGGTLGSNAFTSTAYVPQTTTVNGHPLSSNVTVTPTDLSLVIGTNTEAWSANLDTWSGKTPYAGSLAITTGKTATVTNTLTFSGTDGSTLDVGAGGTLGSAAFDSESALTKTDDTNVTLTLGGAPTTALLHAASITAGWTGTLAISRGGTGAATAAAHTFFANNTGSTAAPSFSSFVSGTDYEVPLTFSQSLSRATNTVTLTNDSASPGNTKYYGTDSGGTKGFFSIPAGVSGANPSASVGLSAVNGSAGTFMRSDAAPALSLSISPAWTGAHDFTGGSIVVTTQSTTDNTTKAASTAYVTTAVANAVAAVNPAVAVAAATTAAGDTSGFTYSNGVGGIAATLTGPTANTAVTVDGFTFTALGQRLLVKDDTQSPSGAFNGVYYLTTLQAPAIKPVFTRALDYDQSSDINYTGIVPVVNGTVNIDTSWLLTSSVTTVGTDPLTYTQFSINPTTIVPTSRTLTIGPTTSDLSANRTFLSSVTNDAQTKAAVVPNTAPSSGQVLVGNAGGTAYSPQSVSGSGATFSLSSAGVLTISAIPNASLSNSSITIGGTSTALGGSVLGNVTNDAQTKAAVVPNTAPSSGQILVGNAGGTAYAAQTLSGSGATATLSNAGVLTLSAIPNATLSNSSITLNSGSSFGITAPGAMSLGSTYTIGSTSDNLAFATVLLGSLTNSPASNYVEAMRQSANNRPTLVLQRNTNTSPTGDFISAYDIASTPAKLFNVDITGTITAGIWHGTTIDNAYLTNSAITIGGTSTALGGTITETTQLDSIGSTQGNVLYRGSSTWSALATGSAGQLLRSGGSSANPAWTTPTYPNAASSSGKVIISDGTNFVTSTPTFPNASATNNKVIKSDGTNWVASTETYAAPGSSGTILQSDGTNWTSASNLGGWSSVWVTTNDATTTSNSLVDITGLVTPTLSNSTVYEIEVVLRCLNAADTAGMKFAIHGGGTGSAATCFASGSSNSSSASGSTSLVINTIDSATIALFTYSNGEGVLMLKGFVTTRSTGTATISIQFLKFTSNTATVRVASVLRYRVAGT